MSLHTPSRSAIAASLALVLATALWLAGCVDDDTSKKIAKGFQRSANQPDEVPVMVNKEPPFRYPAALYARKVQGDVWLRLYVDRDGNVASDSTRIETSSGYASLDSAAVKGSQELRFVPAKLHGEPVAVSVLFPVFFRHPDAPPLPGDTILKSTPTITR